jgi:[acyl-carrier-protein] S-malonyltransferase
MGKIFYDRYEAVRKTFDEADEILGFPLSRIMFEGPEEELVKTKNTQPAILVHSVALMRVLEERGVRPVVAAGHSLGEYSAHVCAKSMTYHDALRTVRLRGELMYEAGLKAPGTMAAILGMTRENIEGVCRDGSVAGIVEPANFNSPDQIVISGELAGVEEAMRIAKERGAKRAIRLDVSGAFHSSLMGEALPGLEDHLDTLEIAEAEIPVVANVDATGVQDREGIRTRLKEQLMRPVLWSDSIQYMAGTGISRFAEVGPGKVLCRLMKKIDSSLSAISVDELESFKSFLSVQQG